VCGVAAAIARIARRRVDQSARRTVPTLSSPICPSNLSRSRRTGRGAGARVRWEALGSASMARGTADRLHAVYAGWMHAPRGVVFISPRVAGRRAACQVVAEQRQGEPSGRFSADVRGVASSGRRGEHREVSARACFSALTRQLHWPPRRDVAEDGMRVVPACLCSWAPIAPAP